jgi:hypothetical protein
MIRIHRDGVFMALLMLVPLSSQAQIPLFEPNGPRPNAVKQGLIGSCYFHASMAALAHTRPEALPKLISMVDSRTYRVGFPDGASENAYREDIDFARVSGYDNSEALWVVVLFRAYAQHILRSALIDALKLDALSSLLPAEFMKTILSNDLLLLAYDRSIRAVVDQSGKILPERFERELAFQMEKTGLIEKYREIVLLLVRRSQILDATSKMINENGELFGAYRAVGQGGLPTRVLNSFSGEKASMQKISAMKMDLLEDLLSRSNKTPAVAGTYVSYQQEELTPQDKIWHLPGHAYTVLSYDRGSHMVALRNPWGDHPEPDGIFTIPLSKFTLLFEVISIEK